MMFSEVFDTLKNVGRINIRINLKVCVDLIYVRITVFRSLKMFCFVDTLFLNVRTSPANYIASHHKRP
jgi:hypothetical protein